MVALRVGGREWSRWRRKISIKRVTGKATSVMRKWRKDATITMGLRTIEMFGSS
jgi:hypothetical protein